MNAFDVGLLHFVNQLTDHNTAFDTLIVYECDNGLLKGGIMMALFWWAWESNGEKSPPERREFLLFGLFASFLALFLARILALTLPFRTRPLHNPALAFQIPESMNPETLIRWSSFPSDHAALFFCLAATLWFVSKRLGAFAFVYSLVMIAFPRIYLGVHYPTDIIAGASLGIASAFLAKAVWLRKNVTQYALGWLDRHPAQAYVLLFLCSFEIAELFDSLRHIALVGFHGVGFLLAKL